MQTTPSLPIAAIDNDQDTLDRTLEALSRSADRIQAIIPEEPYIIVLEDDQLIANSYDRVLNGITKIIHVKNPKDIAPILRQQSIEMIISDSIIAKDMNELKLIKKLAPDTPIVVVSGHDVLDKPEEIAVWRVKGSVSNLELRAMVRNEIHSCTDTLVDEIP